MFLVKVTDGLSELKEVDRASVYEAGKDLAGAAVKVLAQGLTLPYREVSADAFVVCLCADVAATMITSPDVRRLCHSRGAEGYVLWGIPVLR